jgi:hypothetical protein
MTEGVFHSILSLRSSLVFSSFHSGALRRLRTDIQHLGFQIVCSGPGQLGSGSVHVRSVFRSVRLGFVRPGRILPFRGPAPSWFAARGAILRPAQASCLLPPPSLPSPPPPLLLRSLSAGLALVGPAPC